MGAVSQQMHRRMALLTAAAPLPGSRCSRQTGSTATFRHARSGHHTHVGVSHQLQASGVTAGSIILHPVRRHRACPAASADEQPASPEERRSKSGSEEANLQEEVVKFGTAVAQSEQEAFLAAQDQLQQQRQQAEQGAQQAARTERSQGKASGLTHDSRSSVGTGAAAPPAAAAAGAVGPTDRAVPPGSAASVLGDAASPASSSQQPEGSAAQGAAGSAVKLDMAAAVREKLARAAEYRKAKREEEEKQADEPQDGAAAQPQRSQQAGSSDVAAGFLANVMQNTLSPNKNLRPEAFTAMKEAERRKNVEIITVDREYDPTQQGGYADGYKPKVATWGMFPRPPDISKAYGGGRTLRPGQELESEDARAARARRVTQAMKRYKQSTGLEVDPAVQAAAQEQLDTGMRVFTGGQLSASLAHFAEAAALMPLRSPVGGMARLQQAITLDSMGKSQEAKAIYQSLRGHPTAEVARKVKHLLGGFEAMTFLKADKFTSLTVKPHEYDKYFRRMPSAYDNVYYVSAGEEEDLRVPTIFATTIMVLPLLLVGLKVLQKAL